ncbi:hypothetical protein [Edaphobacillus lindanitolerans]|uniref:SGNH/GDSL hydrolase family protein n=1 Tax=Edaphobacillus lindanitolerans TaxID=550447 RepID=A0A1U7PL34_9BACI|nr:hypothetical protein [Edaphobacillus lindanitolerans]SIT73717.1 hypothetical protein SAMN05428946_1014 [Edaphobacillus lindanitolerans]
MRLKLLLPVAIICALILGFSYYAWTSRVEQGAAQQVIKSGSGEASSNDDVQDEQEGEQEDVSARSDLSAGQLEELTANLPKSAAAMLADRLDNGEQAQLLVIGSSSFDAPASQFTSEVQQAYGGFIEPDVYTFDGTSEQFIESELDAVDWKKGYDLVVYEPFTLNNNGQVIIEEEHQDILTVKNRAEEEVDDAAFFITPPQAIHNPNYYLTQINALQKFADDQKIAYIDHWEEWPDAGKDEILEYVDADYKLTEKGIDTWSGALINYFTGK